MFGDFTEFRPPDNAGAARGNQHGQSQRSRSPPISQRNQPATAQGSFSKERWSTGHIGLDEAIKAGNFETTTLDKLAAIPQKERKRWMTDVVTKNIEDPNRWISRCYNNWMADKLAEKATGKDRYGNLVQQSGGTDGGFSPAGCNRSQFGGGMSFGSGSSGPAWNHPNNRPAEHAGEAAGGEGPMWARQVLQMWPLEKAKLIREVCRHLNGEAQELLMNLDAPTSSAICYCLALAVPATEDGASVMLKQWVQRRETLRTPPTSLSPTTTSATVNGTEMEIVLIVMGLTDGRAAILTHAAAKIMQRQGMQNSFQKPIIIAPTTHQEIQLLQTTCGMTPSVPDVNSFQELESYIERTSSEWQVRRTKFLLINVLPPTAELATLQRLPNSNGLHSSGARWIFEAGKIAHALGKNAGEGNVASVLFAPSSVNAHTKEALMSMFGTHLETVTPCLNTVSNTPLTFALPAGCVYQAVVQEKEKCLEHDGWKMDPSIYDWSTKNFSLGSQVVDLLQKKVFDERPWTAEETQMMEAMMSQHTTTQEKRYNNRDWWMKQYGFFGTETPLPAFYKNRLPCHENIYEATGLAGKGPAAIPCGKRRYCENCEQVIQKLDQGYNFSVMVNAVTNVLTKAVGIWKRGGEPLAFARADTWGSIHECGTACVHAESQ